LRGLLVVTEIALALVLLVGAGLLIRTFWELQRVDPGFNQENALVTRLDLPSSKYEEDHQRLAFFGQLIERLSSLPVVQSVGVTQSLPFFGDYILGFRIEGRPEPPPGEVPATNYYAVSPDYFQAMGIPLLRGRLFTERDRQGTPLVAVINETMAERFFPEDEPIGQRIQLTQGSRTFSEIVGIVGDVKQYGLDTDAPAQTYEPFLQRPFSSMNVVVRTAENPAGLNAAVRREVLAIDKDQPLSYVMTLEEQLATSVARERASMRLMTIFGAVALLLAAVGLYGVVAYSVAQRTKELGIRIAFGANSGDVLRLVVRQGMTLALIGVAVGVVAAFAMSRAVASLLYGVTAIDPATFTLVPLVLIAAAFLASCVPAIRVTKLDPLVALREE